MRKRYVNTNLKKILEAAFFGFFTISMFTIAVAGLNKCTDVPPYRKAGHPTNDEIGDHIPVAEDIDEDVDGLNTWTCVDKKNQYS